MAEAIVLSTVLLFVLAICAGAADVMTNGAADAVLRLLRMDR
jgi:hypothetical protein